MSRPACVDGTDACVQDVLVRAGLQPAGYKAESVADQDAQKCTRVIVTFLLNNDAEYRRLADLRRSVRGCSCFMFLNYSKYSGMSGHVC